MIYKVQDSLDQKNWRDVPEASRFDTRHKLFTWWNLFLDANDIDWRIGYYLRCRSGRYFRAVTSKDDKLAKFP